jgi:hypothetical protein
MLIHNLQGLNQCTNLMHQFLYYLYKHLLQSSNVSSNLAYHQEVKLY